MDLLYQSHPSVRPFHSFRSVLWDPLDHLLLLAILELPADLWDPSHHQAFLVCLADPLLPSARLIRLLHVVPSVPSHHQVFQEFPVVPLVLLVPSRRLLLVVPPNTRVWYSLHSRQRVATLYLFIPILFSHQPKFGEIVQRKLLTLLTNVLVNTGVKIQNPSPSST